MKVGFMRYLHFNYITREELLKNLSLHSSTSELLNLSPCILCDMKVGNLLGWDRKQNNQINISTEDKQSLKFDVTQTTFD